jgi:flavin reductase (DIM6/NTAB) family NADH-FMN oxidoreductase RutF
MCYISLRPERYSAPIIKESGVFCINLPTEQLVRSVDFCGVRSGRNTDKFAVCKLTACAGQSKVPMLSESPINLECKVKQIIPLGTHEMYLSEITAVHVEESLMDADGKLHIERAKLLSYAHGGYYALGKRLGTFGYSVQKKKKKPAAKKK